MPPRHQPRSSLSLVTALALSWSSIALAAPGLVKQDTTARSAPFAVAPVLEELRSGTKVSADETATNGWRRVQLADGRFAFVHDTDLAVDLSHVSAAAPAPAAPATTEAAQPQASPTVAAVPVEPLGAPAPVGRAPLYVGDFSHLAELVRSDPKALDLATTYSAEQTFSSAAIWGGVFGGLLLWVLADTALAKNTCVAPGICATTTNDTVRNVGTTILILGPLIGWAARPTRDDQTNVINAWNANHPDRPFIDRAGVEAPR